mgnify:CR=1 FL=1
MFDADQQRAEEARPAQKVASATKELLTTKEVATLTGFSTSYFEKARIYGYGPKFLRIQANGKTGKILYRRSAVESWLAAQECDPEVQGNG